MSHTESDRSAAQPCSSESSVSEINPRDIDSSSKVSMPMNIPGASKSSTHSPFLTVDQDPQKALSSSWPPPNFFSDSFSSFFRSLGISPPRKDAESQSSTKPEVSMEQTTFPDVVPPKSKNPGLKVELTKIMSGYMSNASRNQADESPDTGSLPTSSGGTPLTSSPTSGECSRPPLFRDSVNLGKNPVSKQQGGQVVKGEDLKSFKKFSVGNRDINTWAPTTL